MKKIKISLFLVGFLLLFFTKAIAWDNNVAHPTLANKMVELLTESFTGYDEITDYASYDGNTQCSFINEGAVKEDKGVSPEHEWPECYTIGPITHSNPLCDSSWELETWGSNDCGVTDLSYKTHGYNPLTEEGWGGIGFLNAFDYSQTLWDLIIDTYNSNIPNAYFHVGRFLHLMEDMTSPAHVHVDYHGPGSSDDAETFGEMCTNMIFNVSAPRRPEIDGLYAGDLNPNLRDNNQGNFMKNLAWQTYYMTSYYGGTLVEEEDNSQPDSELKRMFPYNNGEGLRYDNGGLFPDYWIIEDIGKNWNGVGNSQWWENKNDEGYFYIENIDGSIGGSDISEQCEGVTPSVFKVDKFRRILPTDNLDTVLASNNQILATIYTENLFPLAVEWGAGLLQYFYSEVGAGTCPIVISPNGGEVWKSSQSPYTITWDPGTEAGSYVSIELYKGGSLAELIVNLTANDGSYSWTISPSLIEGSDYQIKIISASDPECYVYSDSYFTIKHFHDDCTYTISDDENDFDPSGGTGSVNVTAPIDCLWIATSSESWITITSGSSGNGNGTVNYSVSSYSGESSKTATMTIAGETFTVTQSGCSFNISPTIKSFYSDGGTGSVNVIAPNGCNWTATSSDSWITITSGNSGSGNGTINYSISSYSGTSLRSGSITVEDKTFTVTQTGICIYNISPSSKFFNSSGGTGSVSVTAQSQCSWTATSNDSWITITSGSSGSGDGTVNYSVDSNSNTNSQTGTMTIAGKTFTVSQSECSITVPDDYSTIQEGIDNASDGCKVIVKNGPYYENITLNNKQIILKADGNVTINGSQSGSVVTFTNDRGSVLDGFTITNGSAVSGGGINCEFSSPSITNCTISDNSALDSGGGIYCTDSSSPTITNCVISNNSAYNGGAIDCRNNSSPMINNCTISGNSADGFGGGIFCYNNSSPTITNCVISGNMNPVFGGGIACNNSSSPTITNCVINDNSADHGGGIYCADSSSPTITNCTISENSSSDYGGGLACFSSSSPTMANTILWNNTSTNYNEIYVSSSASIIITYSDIGGGDPDNPGSDYPGTGNIDANPGFVGAGNYHLTTGSLCIDSGTSTDAPAEDIQGTPRPQGSGYDVGAYEFPNCTPGVDTQSCETGLLGICAVGTRICNSTRNWGDCEQDDQPINEICDDFDNNCNGLVDEDFPTKGQSCDGIDSDLCKEGTYVCKVDGVDVECNDTTSDTLEVCDGQDNDCDLDTPNGIDETWFNDLCDGNDSDLCKEGTYQCVDGVQTCSDTTGDILDFCDGVDNDCNLATPDGVDETWFNAPCDSNDLDLCADDIYKCIVNTQTCSDENGDIIEVCDEIDNDCDGDVDENVCPTKFYVSVDITSPVRICFEANQLPCGGIDSIIGVVPNTGSGELTPVDNPCQNSSELIYCVDYDETNDPIGTIVEIFIEEIDSCFESAGFAIARFEVNTDHEYATSFCVTEDGGIVGLSPDPCDPDDVSVEVGVESGYLDLSGADQSVCNGNGVLMSIVGIDPTSNDLSIPNSPIAVCDITISDGSVAGGLTVTLDFVLTDGSTKSDYDNGSKIFEIFSCNGDCDNSANWSSLGVPTVTWASGSPYETNGTFTFTTNHLTKFSATSKSSGGGGNGGDNGGGTQAASGGGGCSVTPTIQSTFLGSAVANTLIMFLPLIIFGIRRIHRGTRKK